MRIPSTFFIIKAKGRYFRMISKESLYVKINGQHISSLIKLY